MNNDQHRPCSRAHEQMSHSSEKPIVPNKVKALQMGTCLVCQKRIIVDSKSRSCSVCKDTMCPDCLAKNAGLAMPLVTIVPINRKWISPGKALSRQGIVIQQPRAVCLKCRKKWDILDCGHAVPWSSLPFQKKKKELRIGYDHIRHSCKNGCGSPPHDYCHFCAEKCQRPGCRGSICPNRAKALKLVEATQHPQSVQPAAQTDAKETETDTKQYGQSCLGSDAKLIDPGSDEFCHETHFTCSKECLAQMKCLRCSRCVVCTDWHGRENKNGDKKTKHKKDEMEDVEASWILCARNSGWCRACHAEMHSVCDRCGTVETSRCCRQCMYCESTLCETCFPRLQDQCNVCMVKAGKTRCEYCSRWKGNLYKEKGDPLLDNCEVCRGPVCGSTRQCVVPLKGGKDRHSYAYSHLLCCRHLLMQQCPQCDDGKIPGPRTVQQNERERQKEFVLCDAHRVLCATCSKTAACSRCIPDYWQGEKNETTASAKPISVKRDTKGGATLGNKSLPPCIQKAVATKQATQCVWDGNKFPLLRDKLECPGCRNDRLEALSILELSSDLIRLLYSVLFLDLRSARIEMTKHQPRRIRQPLFEDDDDDEEEQDEENHEDDDGNEERDKEDKVKEDAE